MSKFAKYFIGILIAVAVGYLLWYFSSIVAYILVSAVLAIIGRPLVDTIERVRISGFRLPRWFAALLTVAAIWAVTVLFFTFFIPLVFTKLSELSKLDVPYIVDSFRQPLQSFQDFIVRFFSVSDTDFSLSASLTEQLSENFNLVDSINVVLSRIVSIVGNTVVALFSITFITFFFLKEENLFQNMVVSLFPRKYEENIVHAIGSITKLLIRYFTGIIAESAAILIVLSAIFLLWGFTAETALFMGLVMGVLNVIPYIGPLIGICVCVVVGVVSPMAGYSAVQMAMITALSISVVKCVDDFVLQPALYSKRVRAHPLEIFLVILIAGSLAGVWGMLLAIPAYNVIRVVAKEFFNNYRLVQKLTENM